jgi:hypothetical protein
VSPVREELLRLVENLADHQVPAVRAEVRRHLEPAAEPSSSWPPPWFGAVRSGPPATASRAKACDPPAASSSQAAAKHACRAPTTAAPRLPAEPARRVRTDN